MSEETVIVEKKKSGGWFSRICSAVAGLVVGIASMFGIDRGQINEIKGQAQQVQNQIQQVQEAIKTGDYVNALENVADAIDGIQKITGDVKDAADDAKKAAEEYKNDIDAIVEAARSKDYAGVAAQAKNLVAKINAKVPADQLTGIPLQIHSALEKLIADIDGGRFDGINKAVNNLRALIGLKGDLPDAE